MKSISDWHTTINAKVCLIDKLLWLQKNMSDGHTTIFTKKNIWLTHYHQYKKYIWLTHYHQYKNVCRTDTLPSVQKYFWLTHYHQYKNVWLTDTYHQYNSISDWHTTINTKKYIWQRQYHQYNSMSDWHTTINKKACLTDTLQHAHRFFHLGLHVPFYLHFWGCNVPSNSSFGGTKKINCIFSTQGRAPCCFL